MTDRQRLRRRLESGHGNIDYACEIHRESNGSDSFIACITYDVEANTAKAQTRFGLEKSEATASGGNQAPVIYDSLRRAMAKLGNLPDDFREFLEKCLIPGGLVDFDNGKYGLICTAFCFMEPTPKHSGEVGKEGRNQ